MSMCRICIFLQQELLTHFFLFCKNYRQIIIAIFFLVVTILTLTVFDFTHRTTKMRPKNSVRLSTSLRRSEIDTSMKPVNSHRRFYSTWRMSKSVRCRSLTTRRKSPRLKRNWNNSRCVGKILNVTAERRMFKTWLLSSFVMNYHPSAMKLLIISSGQRQRGRNGLKLEKY